MSAAASTPARRPRVCACVMMNHPFPAILPLLRRLYTGRFSEVRFLVPFERMPNDPDVITVYRGSYNHAAYLTDAKSQLSAIDCDYYIVIHDDVMLNPKFDEETFFDTLPLGPDDGFIGEAGRMPPQFGDWVWNAAFVPKLLFPKSLLFGSGVEAANVRKYLPDADSLRQALESNGVAYSESIQFDPSMMADIGRHPAHVLLHGLAHPVTDTDADRQVHAESLEIFRRLAAVLLAADRLDDAGKEGIKVDLPIPACVAGYFSDFYVLPKSGFDDFAHYMGVASAANLFVEIMVPTLLHACCARVQTAASMGVDLSGFRYYPTMDWFEDPKALARHPMKLSYLLKEPKVLEAFFEDMADLKAWNASSAEVSRSWGPGGRYRRSGWHESENWGAWSSQEEAVIQVPMREPSDIRIVLAAPVHEGARRFSGVLRLNQLGSELEVPFEVTWPSTQTEVVLRDVQPDDDGLTLITLMNETLIRPMDIGVADPRALGFGLVDVRRVAPTSGVQPVKPGKRRRTSVGFDPTLSGEVSGSSNRNAGDQQVKSSATRRAKTGRRAPTAGKPNQ